MTLEMVVLAENPSLAKVKLPALLESALNLKFPPLTLTRRIRAASETSLVLETGLAFSKARFFLWTGILPPVNLLLCLESLLMPMAKLISIKYLNYSNRSASSLSDILLLLTFHQH